jgi:outer membrane usher protein FimD/PapC
LLLVSAVSFTQTTDASAQSANISSNSLAQSNAKADWDLVVEIHINGETVGDMEHVLQPEPGKFYATAESFADWRLTAPAKPGCVVDGVKYYAIDALPGATVTLDPVLQVLLISVPPGLFRGQRVGGGRPPEVKADSGLGMFVNHDIRLIEFEGHTQRAGVMEAEFFSSAGVLTSQFSDANVVKNSRPIWLDTTFQTDFPEQRAAFTIGDATAGHLGAAGLLHRGALGQ